MADDLDFFLAQNDLMASPRTPSLFEPDARAHGVGTRLRLAFDENALTDIGLWLGSYVWRRARAQDVGMSPRRTRFGHAQASAFGCERTPRPSLR